MFAASHRRSGRVTWTTIRNAIATVDASHPNASEPTDEVAATVERSHDVWVRVFNAAATTAPSLVFTVYGKMGAAGTWARIAQLNGGSAIAPTTGQALSVANRINWAEIVNGLAAWDYIWVSVTGTMGTGGTCTVQLGREEP